MIEGANPRQISLDLKSIGTCDEIYLLLLCGSAISLGDGAAVVEYADVECFVNISLMPTCCCDVNC